MIQKTVGMSPPAVIPQDQHTLLAEFGCDATCCQAAKLVCVGLQVRCVGRVCEGASFSGAAPFKRYACELLVAYCGSCMMAPSSTLTDLALYMLPGP